MNINSFRSIDYLENSYLIYDDNGNAALVDPGFYFENEKRAIEAYMLFLNLRIQMILLTHAHIDHVMGCSYMMKKFNIPAYIHEKDVPALKKMKSYAATLNYYVEDVPDRFVVVSEADRISVGSLQFEVLHTPGHTPGSIAFFNAPEKTLFSGDIIYNNDIGRIDLPGGNGRELKKTIDRVFSMDPNIKLLAGHGPETTVGYEKKFNLRAHEFIAAENIFAS